MASIDNGNGDCAKLRIEKRDWLKIAGIVFGIIAGTIGIMVPLMMYVFMPRVEAMKTHTTIEVNQALMRQEVDLRYEFDQKQDTALRRDVEHNRDIAAATHANVQELMKVEEIRKSKIRAMPARSTRDMENP